MTADLSWLDAIEARLAAATPGPWEVGFHQHPERGCMCLSCHVTTGYFVDTPSAFWCSDVQPEGAHPEQEYCDETFISFEDATLAANAPTDIARLVKALRDAHAKIARVEALLPKFDAVYGPNGYVPVHVRSALAEEDS